MPNNHSLTRLSPAGHNSSLSSSANANNNNYSSAASNNSNNNNEGGADADAVVAFDGGTGGGGSIGDYNNPHNVGVNLFGAFCTTCVIKPLFATRGTNLWVPTHHLLGQHWKDNQCFSFETPNARETQRELKAQQIQLHNQLQQSTQEQVNTLIAAEFPAGSKVLGGKFYYCVNCGFNAKRKSNMDKHFKNARGKRSCNASQHQKEGGDILVGSHGMKCPRAIVELVRQKRFTLPYPHAPAIVNVTTPTIPRTATRNPAVRTNATALQQHNGEYSLIVFYFDVIIHI